MHNAQKEIVEKIVEREVIKEVRVGISKEEMAALEKRSEDERQRIMKQAQVQCVSMCMCEYICVLVWCACVSRRKPY